MNFFAIAAQWRMLRNGLILLLVGSYATRERDDRVVDNVIDAGIADIIKSTVFDARERCCGR